MDRLALALFLCAFSLQAGSPASSTSKNLLLGKKAFQENCAQCHGANGVGAFGPSLLGKLKHGSDRAQITEVITRGLPRTAMPASKLPPATLNSVVDYVLSLRKR